MWVILAADKYTNINSAYNYILVHYKPCVVSLYTAYEC